MDYKELSKAEKIEHIRKMNFCRAERRDAAVYLKTLWRDDKAVTDEYENFGDRPYQFFLNRRIGWRLWSGRMEEGIRHP